MINPADMVKEYTKSPPERLAAMVDALEVIEAQRIAGDIVECGVWRGGNIMLARLLCPDRVCWLLDTFDGMTEPDAVLDVKPDGRGGRAIDKYRSKTAAGLKWNAVSFDEVTNGFLDLGLFNEDKLNFLIGPVESTLPDNPTLPDRIAILRLDMDWYSPTKVALDCLFPRLSEDGFLIVDDYGHWLGCKKAVDEYFGDRTLPFRDVDYSCRVFRKC